jgi:transitional endoplasmic reticulum ATPase
MALLLADALFAALHPPCVDGAAPPRVCIVATSQAMDTLPAPLLRPWLWSRCHTLEAPDQKAREALLALLVCDADHGPARGEAHQASVDFAQLAARTEGFVAADFAALVASAAHLMDVDADSAAPGVAREHTCWAEALDSALLAHSPLHLSALGATKVEVTLRHVGGMAEAKAQLTEVLAWPLLYPALMQGLPVKRPAGVLLHGPSGCGKTLLAQVGRRRVFSSPGA